MKIIAISKISIRLFFGSILALLLLIGFVECGVRFLALVPSPDWQIYDVAFLIISWVCFYLLVILVARFSRNYITRKERLAKLLGAVLAVILAMVVAIGFYLSLHEVGKFHRLGNLSKVMPGVIISLICFFKLVSLVMKCIREKRISYAIVFMEIFGINLHSEKQGEDKAVEKRTILQILKLWVFRLSFLLLLVAGLFMFVLTLVAFMFSLAGIGLAV